MEVIVLASGSKGNATFIKTQETKILIDAGISLRMLKKRLSEHQETIDDLDAVFLTHEHSDHTKGLSTLFNNTRAILYTSALTFDALNGLISIDRFMPLEPGEALQFKDLSIEAFEASHDAVHALGFIMHNGTDKQLVYVTDTGFISKDLYPKIKDASMYIFESNYDVALLFNSGRPYYLKRRIDSVKGHLSNADAAYHLSQLVGSNTKAIVLAHRSEDCNTDEHCLQTIADVFEDYALNINHYDFSVAKQHHPSKRYKL